jgi:hypothetical protein
MQVPDEGAQDVCEQISQSLIVAYLKRKKASNTNDNNAKTLHLSLLYNHGHTTHKFQR